MTNKLQNSRMEYQEMISNIVEYFGDIKSPIREIIIQGEYSSHMIACFNQEVNEKLTEALTDSTMRKTLGLFPSLPAVWYVSKVDEGLYSLDIKVKLNKKVKKNIRKAKEELSLSEQVAERNYLSRALPVIKTDAQFMDFMAKVHGEFSQDDKNKSVGMQTVIIDTFSAMLNIEDDKKFLTIVKLALNNCNQVKKAYNELEELTGTDEYIPVNPHYGMKDDILFKFVPMSEFIEFCIFGQLERIDLNNADNLRALVRDLNDCGRMYQELTLDAAKKLYDVAAKFYQEIVRAESTIHFTHNFISLKEMDEFIMARNKYDMEDDYEIGDYKTFYKQDGSVKRITFRDCLAHIQNSSKQFLTEHMNVVAKEAYANTEFSKETIDDLDLNGVSGQIAMDLFELIIKPYNIAVSERRRKADQVKNDKKLSNYQAAVLNETIAQELQEKIDLLSNLTRFYTKDLTMVEAGRALFAASNIFINGKESEAKLKEDTSSTAYMHIAPELALAYFAATHAEMKDCGYKLLGDTSSINEGDVIEFANGNAVGYEDVYVDDDYTGTLTIKTVNEVLSAVVDINELLEANRVPYTAPDKISLRIYGSGLLDCVHFAKTKKRSFMKSHEEFDEQRIFEKAEKAVLYPIYRYENHEGKMTEIENAVVVTVPSKADPNVKFEIPACRYLCFSHVMEEIYAGLTFKGMDKNNNVNGSLAWAKVDYGTYTEVERRIVKEAPSLETGDFEYVFDVDIKNNGYAPSATDDAFSVSNTTNSTTPTTATDIFDVSATNTTATVSTTKTVVDDYMADFANDEQFDATDESKQGFSGVDFNIYDELDTVSTTTVNTPSINEELTKAFGEGYSDEMVEVDQEAIDDANSVDWSIFDNM